MGCTNPDSKWLKRRHSYLLWQSSCGCYQGFVCLVQGDTIAADPHALCHWHIGTGWDVWQHLCRQSQQHTSQGASDPIMTGGTYRVVLFVHVPSTWPVTTVVGPSKYCVLPHMCNSYWKPTWWYNKRPRIIPGCSTLHKLDCSLKHAAAASTSVA